MSFWENTEPGSQNTYLEIPLELLLGASVSQFHSVFFGPDWKNPNNCKYVCSRSIKDEWLLLNMSCCVRCCNIVDRVYRGIVCTFCSSFHNPFKVTLFNVIYLWVVFVLQACALYLRLGSLRVSKLFGCHCWDRALATNLPWGPLLPSPSTSPLALLSPLGISRASHVLSSWCWYNLV